MKFTDQTGYILELEQSPKRILSLVPSQTELLHYFGLEEEVLGITKFCIHPESWFKSKIKIGGTKKINLSIIDELNPDLIIGNMEENEKSDIEYLRSKYNVWMSDVICLEDCFVMMKGLGEILGVKEKADSLVHELKRRFHDLSAFMPDESEQNVAYIIWQEPLMAAAGKTFINDMLEHAGYNNVFSSFKRYPEISTADLQSAEPDFIFLSSEPYPFSVKHIEHFQSLCPDSKVVLVDGELFSWYGNRLLEATDYYKNLHAYLNNYEF